MPIQHLPITRWLARQRRQYGLTWLAAAQRAGVDRSTILLLLRAQRHGFGKTWPWCWSAMHRSTRCAGYSGVARRTGTDAPARRPVKWQPGPRGAGRRPDSPAPAEPGGSTPQALTR